MASHYRTMMVEALRDLDNNQHSNGWYTALAWIGLKNTVAWNHLTQQQQTNINSIISNVKTNGTHNCN